MSFLFIHLPTLLEMTQFLYNEPVVSAGSDIYLPFIEDIVLQIINIGIKKGNL